MSDPLDEILFDYIEDYVDGTMDPTVRSVFEEYLSQNAAVEQFVCDAIDGKRYVNRLPMALAPVGLKDKLMYSIEQMNVQANAQQLQYTMVPSFTMIAGIATVLSGLALGGYFLF